MNLTLTKTESITMGKRFYLKYRFCVLAVPIIVFFLTHSIAIASLNEQIAIDAKAISLANTVTSSPPGMMSIHYNPAGLSQLKGGKQFMITFAALRLEISGKFESDPDFEGFLGGKFNDDKLDGASGKTSDLRIRAPFIGEIDIPGGMIVSPIAFGFSYREENSRWTFANGFYAPYVGGFSHNDKDDPMVYGGKSLYIQHFIYLSPSCSYQFSDDFSAGLSIGIGQSAMGAELDIRAPSELVALTNEQGDTSGNLDIPVLSQLDAPAPWFGGGISPYDTIAKLKFKTRDDFSPSYNIGFLWEPIKWFSLGACYQSEVKAKMRGEYMDALGDSFQNAIDWLGLSPPTLVMSQITGLPAESKAYEKGYCSLEFIFPQRLQVGITVRPIKSLKLMTDMHWTEGSANKTLALDFDQDMQVFQFITQLGYSGGSRSMVVDLDMKNTLHFSYALEFQAREWLSLRCGYEARESSVQDDHFTLLAPFPDLDILGAGIGISLKNGLKVDLAGSYIYNKGFTVPNNTSKQLNSTTFTDIFYNPYAGLDYEQDIEIFELAMSLSMPTNVVGHSIDRFFEVSGEFMRNLNPF
ncbi:MAG: outer membrane protein transport protein [Proteobacteria bacterium]|nr:outer membrane protein transport protein [Pseudomonadota bacterium]